MSRGRVLVVDDHVSLAENIAEVLQTAGYDATIASSGEEALGRSGDPDLVAVITDFRLPGMTGVDLIAAMRQRGSRVPAIVMSAYTDAGTVDAAEDAGAMDVLGKPLDLERLVGTLAVIERGGDQILIVDDNRPLAENVAEAVRVTGLEPVVSGTAEEALGRHLRPSAAVIDYRLPDRSGVEVARRLVARDPAVRILFISGYPDELRLRLAGETLAAPVIGKPLDLAKIVAWAQEVARSGRANPRR